MITYPFSDLGVRQALLLLGDTANAVATNLSNLGFRGVPGSENADPVANYLLAVIEGATDADVYADDDEFFAEVRAGREADVTPRVSVSADLPLATTQFILRFDQRLYPDLIEETSA